MPVLVVVAAEEGIVVVVVVVDIAVVVVAFGVQVPVGSQRSWPCHGLSLERFLVCRHRCAPVGLAHRG